MVQTAYAPFDSKDDILRDSILEDIKKEYGDNSPENMEKAHKLLLSEVETYDKYIPKKSKSGYITSF